MSDNGSKNTVLSLGQLLEQQPSAAPACLIEPGLLPAQGILFVGSEPRIRNNGARAGVIVVAGEPSGGLGVRVDFGC